MGRDGLRADEEPARDRVVPEAVAEQLEHLELPLGQAPGDAHGAGARAADEVRQPRQQLARGVGLGEVVVGAEQQAGDAVVGLRAQSRRGR